MIIRSATLDEIEAIRALFEDEVRAGKMLPRSADAIRSNITDWLVADAYGHVVGCVSLVLYNQALCEVRSLAVHADYRGNGIATDLIKQALVMARERRMRQVLTLTRAPQLFEKIGFRRDFVANFPEKVWRDCAPCPFRHACDEIALLYTVN
ncbi:MAG: GNAT family N-acetyltransferase [Anaerolineae bacterium]|nr:GNAT family N-acetyltransferase [Anaerolineae bacterium]